MKKNIGTTDRTIRVLLATVVAILYFVGEISGTTALVLGVLALLLLVTSALSFCPLYAVFNITTTKQSRGEDR